jgi:hypothetical protein
MNITEKQLIANKINAKKWWVKTQKWKDKVKNNALKHGLSWVIYDKDFEEELIWEYKIKWSLEKMLIRNICISKARFEKWVMLEDKLLKNIINPTKYNKVYKNKTAWEKYLIEKKEAEEKSYLDVFWPTEPDFYIEKQTWEDFELDLKKLDYLINTIWKYNHQNETRLNKGVLWLLHLLKK